jgi:primosomal protein N' (replication factor Y)
MPGQNIQAITEEKIEECPDQNLLPAHIGSSDPRVQGVLSDAAASSADASTGNVPELTTEQKMALDRILPAINAHRYETFLVQGVTGSGKTELYMRVVAEVVAAGRQAIVLVPEISLTPMIVERFEMRFGSSRVAVLHSRLSAGERFEQWLRIREGQADIVVGARSAAFAPCPNLGAVIVDEEHETTYKSDMMPRYDTVEIAVKRASRCRAIALLGSATPSVVSMYRAERGYYHLLSMTKRYNETPLPQVLVADMRIELKQGNRSIFSAALNRGIADCLAAGRQAILFLNRRGYSPFIVCRNCGYVIRCPECGITMTWHKSIDRAICHFCGHSETVPETCPECGGAHLRHFGVGTEQVEEMTRQAFPDAGIARLDMDTTTAKGSIARILKDFGKGKTDILIGTQMVAKGLDFRRVSIVGVIAADIGLNIPDFRASERSFQLITQAGGRSGRGDELGTVVVQTYDPGHYAVKAAATGDYKAFYETEIMLRHAMKYPPFSDILQVTVASENESAAELGINHIAAILAQAAGCENVQDILGPQRAWPPKVGEEYRFRLYVKSSAKAGAAPFAETLWGLKKKINTDATLKYRIIIDRNPFSLI